MSIEDLKKFRYTLIVAEENLKAAQSRLKLAIDNVETASEKYANLLSMEPDLSPSEEGEMEVFMKNLKVIQLITDMAPNFSVRDYFGEHGHVTPKQARVMVDILWKHGGKALPAKLFPPVRGIKEDFEAMPSEIRDYLAPVSKIREA